MNASLRVVGVMALLLSPSASASSPPQHAPPTPIHWPNDSKASPPLRGASLQVLEDPAGSLTLGEVTTSRGFKETTAPISNFGFTPSAFWVRTAITNHSPEPRSLFLTLPNPFYDTVDVYQLNDDLTLAHQWHTGDHQSFNSRPVKTTGYAFPLELAPSTTTPVYLRITNSEIFWLEVRLESIPAFTSGERPRYVTLGLLYGVIGIMVLYNFALFFIIGAPNYLVYSVYLFLHSLFLASFRGVAYEFLWGDSPRWHGVTNTVLPCLLFVSVLGFVRLYLNTRKELPRLDQISNRVMVATLLAVPFLVLLDRHLSNQLVSAGSFVGLLWVCFVAVTAQVQGVRFATVLNTAFGCLILTYLCLATLIFPPPGITPPTWLMEYLRNVGLEFAVGLEATLLSLGVGYRINVLRTEAADLEKTNRELESRARERLEREVQQQTQALRATLTELEQTQNTLVSQARMATVGNLTSGVAHEIRNPLNVTLGGSAAILEVVEELSPTAVSALGSAHQTLKTCASLISRGSHRIEDIVAKLQQLTEAPGDHQKTTCLLHKTASSTLQILKAPLAKRNIAVHITIPEELSAPINVGELSQVLLNLILNSIEAIGKDGTIVLKGEEREGQLLLSVTDSGPGVAPEIRESIFDAFFTTKSQGEGSGLGLALSSKMVADAGGDLTLRENTEGAVFEIRLPAAEVPAPEARELPR